VLAATWFVAYSAVLPLTQAEWGLSAKQAGLIQSAFHLGYLSSLFIVGFIADHFGAKRAYITTGVAACLSPWAFVLFADGFWSAFWLHALTGLCQGGTYTPALALINDNVERARRGRAMGFLKRVIKTTFRDGHPAQAHSSFEQVSEAQLEQHLSIARYGSFLLTDAVRPRLTWKSCRAPAAAATSIAIPKHRSTSPC